MIDFVKVGMRIAEHRKRLGLSQEELADKLYVTRQALSKWENGTSVPSLDTLSQISKLFSVSFEELLGLFDKEKLDVDENDIFRGHDRSFILSKIVSGEVKVKIHDVLYQMSPAERMYILKHLKEGKLKASPRELWVKLTPSEQKYLGGTIYEIY
ncbi:MAG: helix-turn-helix transcriptional regulator [Clostridia bacterium]|nr:helix-turn-helix transcriptional regulator [Clostridia bacterium]